MINVIVRTNQPEAALPRVLLSGFRQGLDVLADTSSARVRQEVDRLRPYVPATLDDLARGDRRSIRGLARLSERYCQVAFGSRRTAMEDTLGRERARSRWPTPACRPSSSAGAHAQVLRRAGLITGTRHASMVIHRLTRLGGDLIQRRQ